MSLSDYHCGWLTVRIWGLDIHYLIYILVFCFPLALCLVHSVAIKFSPCLDSCLSKRSHILIKTFSVFMMRKKKKSKSFGPAYCFLPAIFFFSLLRGKSSLWRPGRKNSTWKNENTRAGSTKPRSAEDPESASVSNKPQKSGFQNRQAGLFAGPNDHYLPKLTPRMFCKTDLNKLTHWPLSAHFCFASEYVKFGQPSWLTFSCLSLNTATTQTLSGMSLFKSSIRLLTVLQTKFCVYCIFFYFYRFFCMYIKF